MGEAKRKRDKLSPEEKLAIDFSRELANNGLLIRAGWALLRTSPIFKQVPDKDIDLYRLAFEAGASHLFTCMVTMGDDTDNPDDVTSMDMKRMELINAEVEEIEAKLKFGISKTEGES